MKRRNIPALAIAIVGAVIIACGVIYRIEHNSEIKWRRLIDSASNYHRSGSDGQAEACLNEAAAIARKMKDSDSALGLTLNNLGEVYEREGKYGNAERALEQALKHRLNALGSRDYNTAITMRNLSGVYCDQGRYLKAKNLLMQAMATAEVARGAHHPAAGLFLSDLGIIHLNTGRYAEAEKRFREALSISRDKSSRNGIITNKSNISYACSLQGKYKEAEAFARQALSQAEKEFGPKHMYTLMAKSNLGQALVGLGKYSEAQLIYEDALHKAQLTLGSRHPQTAMFQGSLSNLLLRKHEYAKAEHLCKQALAINEQVLGALHVESIKVRYCLVEIYRAEKEYGKAELLFKMQIADARKSHGPYSGLLIAAYEDYSHFLKTLNRNGEAENAAARAKMIRKERQRKNWPVEGRPVAYPALG